MTEHQVKKCQGEESAVPAGFCSRIDSWGEHSRFLKQNFIVNGPLLPVNPEASVKL